MHNPTPGNILTWIQNRNYPIKQNWELEYSYT